MFQAELALDVLAVRFNRFEADVQLIGSLSGAPAFPKQTQDDEFAVGEPLNARPTSFKVTGGELLQDALGNSIGKIQITHQDGTNCLEHVLRRLVLGNKP